MTDRMDRRLQRQIRQAKPDDLIEGIVLFIEWQDIEAHLSRLTGDLNMHIEKLRLLPRAHVAIVSADPLLFTTLLEDDNVSFISATTIDVF